MTLPRVHRRACGVVRQISLGLAEPRRTYTHARARYVLELSQYVTIQDVARHSGVSWDIVKDIHKRHLKWHYARPSLRNVRRPVERIAPGRRSRRYRIAPAIPN